MTLDKMKTYHPKQVIEIGFQVDYLTPKKKRLFEERRYSIIPYITKALRN